MKKVELRDNQNGYEILEDGHPVGRVTKSGSGFGWQSYQSKAPFHQGRCEKEEGALAHIGYRKVPPKKKKRGGK